MATRRESTVYGSFAQVSSGIPSAGTASLEASVQVVATPSHDAQALLAGLVRDIAGATGSQLADAALNSGLLSSVAGATKTNGGSGGPVLSSVLKSGLGVMPLVSGIMRLFGGGSNDTPEPLVKYAAPPSIRFEAAQWGNQMGDAGYDQAGLARVYRAEAAPALEASRPAEAANGGSPNAPTITVNVQAMDSRSFLDHSQEIARAVRDAMLNLNAINDVVNDI
jgi:hypothetical protein